MRVIARTDLPMAIEEGGVEFRTDRAGENNIAWVRLPAGADLRPGLAGLPGDLCPCPHWGYMISGRWSCTPRTATRPTRRDRPSTGPPGMRRRLSRTASTSTCRRPPSSRRSSATYRAAPPRSGGRNRCTRRSLSTSHRAVRRMGGASHRAHGFSRRRLRVGSPRSWGRGGPVPCAYGSAGPMRFGSRFRQGTHRRTD